MHLFSHFSYIIGSHLTPSSSIILALSGGIDSRVLLELLRQYQNEHPIQPCLAIYIHHGLSQNADIWAEKCKEWCAQANIPFILEKIKLPEKKGQSLEKLARDARYSALKKHIKMDDLLLTGQHGNDQIETFLLALKRGSGPKGLSCMAESSEFHKGKLIRPLLKSQRIEIEQFASEHNLKWVEDESNQNVNYDRNFLRHAITPLLSKRWPNFYRSIQRSAELCAEQEELIVMIIEPILLKALDSDGGVSIDCLLKEGVLIRSQVLRMWFAHHNKMMPSRRHLHMIWDQVAIAQQDGTPSIVLSDIQVNRFKNKLYFVEKHPAIDDWKGILNLNERLILPAGVGSLALKENSATNIENRDELQIKAPKNGQIVTVHFQPEGFTARP